jgi:hypothetical protein
MNRHALRLSPGRTGDGRQNIGLSLPERADLSASTRTRDVGRTERALRAAGRPFPKSEVSRVVPVELSFLASQEASKSSTSPAPSGQDESPLLRHDIPAPLSELFRALYALERHRGTLEILFLLYTENPLSKSRLRQRLRPGPDALECALHTLGQLWLVAFDTVDRFPFGRVYRLTGRGRALIELPPRSWSFVLTR